MSRVKKKPRPDIQFLRDYAITSARDDEFRHASVAKTLERIIEQASTPMTIGMFGSWGAGKSGISSMLMASLRKKKKIACIEFDVWKYEDEASLRRQFIHSLLRQLTEQGLAGKANLNERLEGSVSEEVTEPAIDRAALTRLVLLLLVIIAAALSGHALVVTGVSLAAIISVVGLNTIVKSGLEII
ncbi:MAG TPA: P-loop NTPase fold protein, partial [Candidatus Saccharimonadales bacterium]|nr:P-loop NTPase fold protein [Candidatus Saccharimonadales bacterium]